MGQHAVIAPHKAHVLANCAGSIKQSARYADRPPSQMSMEGEAIHECAKIVLSDFIYHDFKGHTYKREDFLDRPMSNGVVLNEEMLDVAEMYIREVINTSSSWDGLTTIVVEHTVYMPQVHPENWGTLDAAILFFHPTRKRLKVMDLKSGWKIVEVYECWQLIDYTIGILNECLERGWPVPDEIELCIVQPRPAHRHGKVRSWVLKPNDLVPYVNHLHKQAHDAMSDNPSYTAGAHCVDCVGRHGCPVLQQSAYKVVETVRNITPQDLIGADLGKHLTMLDEAKAILKALYDGLEEVAIHQIQNGSPVLGWEYAQKESRVNWTTDKKEIAAIGDLYGVDIRKPMDLLTPLQAISAGMPEEVVKANSSKKFTGAALIPFDSEKTSKLFKQG